MKNGRSSDRSTIDINCHARLPWDKAARPSVAAACPGSKLVGQKRMIAEHDEKLTWPMQRVQSQVFNAQPGSLRSLKYLTRSDCLCGCIVTR